MATPEEIKEAQKLLDKIAKAYKQLGDINPFAKIDASKLKDADNEIEQLSIGLEGVLNRIENTKSSFTDLSSALKAVVKEINPKAVDATKAFTTGFKNVIREAKQLQYEEEGINKLSKKQLETLQEKVKQERFSTKNAAEQLVTDSKVSVTIDRRTKAYKALDVNYKAAINYLREEDQITQTILDKTQQRIEQETRIEKLLGLGGAAVAGTKSALDKLGFGGLASALGLDEVQNKMRKVAEEIEKASGATLSFADKMKVLKAGISEAGTQFKQSLKDPAAIATILIKEMVSALQGADKATGELAKSFGTSYSEAASLRNELNTVANLSGDVNITTAALQKSLVAINKELGTASSLNGELLKDFTQLTTVAGYTEEAALGLSKITLATGTDLSENTSEILGQAVAFNAVNGLALNEKEIVEGVAKASAAATLSLGMQPKELAKAVAQSKALGVSLDQVENISQSLLNFESSISAELEAELLTGKNLNLEKARLAALNGDLATVAEEIAKQTGSAADFTKMNVIQQEALAKSVGMTREDLAKSLIEREALAAAGLKEGTAVDAYNKLKKDGLSDDQIAKKLGDDKLAAQLKSQSVQERFNASVEKLKEIFISLAGPILQIVSPFMDLVTTILPLINVALNPIMTGLKEVSKYAKEILGIFGGIYAIQKLLAITEAILIKRQAAKVAGKTVELGLGQSILTIMGFQNAIAGYQLAKEEGMNTFRAIGVALEQTKLGSIIAQGVGIIKNIGKLAIENTARLVGAASALATNSAVTFGVGAAVAVAAAIAAYASIKALTADDMVSPGYGERTLFGPEGAIQLNDKDTVIAGTNLGGGEKTQPSNTSSPSINLSPLIERMSAVENLLSQILSKEGTVFLDGNKVGTAMAMSTYKTQ